MHPGLGAFNQQRDSLSDLPPEWAQVEHMLRAGKMICLPIYKGSFDRSVDSQYLKRFNERPTQARNERVATILDLRRTVDYLMTRDDVNLERLIYYGLSWGAMTGPIALVAEPRFKAGVFVSGGYWNWERKVQPEISTFQFARHVKQPVIMINGSGDRIFLLQESQLTLFGDLTNPQNDHRPLPCGHTIPPELIMQEMLPWLESIFDADVGNSDLTE